MSNVIQAKLLNYLRDELFLSSDSINLALKHIEQDPGPLPMILWHYGLISIEQLSKIYDWLETASS
jgi:hypothetical protein